MAMEDFRIDVIVGRGRSDVIRRIAPFTLVGATTRWHAGPLRDRFGFTAQMEFYDTPELGS